MLHCIWWSCVGPNYLSWPHYNVDQYLPRSEHLSRCSCFTLSSDPSSSICLDAFIVALNQSCEQEPWYTSTKELHLASLGLCGACRDGASLCLTFTHDAPHRLLAAADARVEGSARVPRLRAHTVTWARRSSKELSSPLYALTAVEYLAFGSYFNSSIEDVAWPHRLRVLRFGQHFNQPIGKVSWPPSLQQLAFGRHFNQPIGKVSWSPSIQQLAFGEGFDQPIGKVSWPPSLQQLAFCARFDQPLSSVSWPPTLQQLTFDGGPYHTDFNQLFSNVVGWCCSSCMSHDHLNQPIANVQWPPSLKHLALAHGFNQSVVDAQCVLPSLQQITFGYNFNQSVDCVTWPPLLQQLAFGNTFDQPIEKVVWPPSLRKLTFGRMFNQVIEGVSWPASVEQIVFGCCFNQSVAQVTWPTSLQDLAFGFFRAGRLGGWMNSTFNQAIDLAVWPSSLRRLRIGGKFNQSLHALGAWMPFLEEVTLLVDDHSLVVGIEWPKNLRKVTLLNKEEHGWLHGVLIPPTAELVEAFESQGGDY